MRYELADYEWVAIKPMLPNKLRGVPRVNDRRVLNGIFWVLRSGAWANIPPKSNRSNPICFSPYLYRSRNQVERFFNRIKQCRRVATRYDRLAANYLAFVQLASIRLWLRFYESAS
jgi:transposase